MPLSTLMKHQIDGCSNLNIPIFAHRAIQFIYRYGIKEKGIFRISANAASLTKVQQAIDEGKLTDLVNGVDCDCHLVAGLLKSWLRQLPDCLFTTELYHEFIGCVDDPSIGPNLSKIKATIESLPTINYNVAKELFKLYVAVKDNKEYNSMGSDNVATTNAPNLINPKIDNLDIMDSLMKGNQLVKAIIDNYDVIFALPEATNTIQRKLFDEDSTCEQQTETEFDNEDIDEVGEEFEQDEIQKEEEQLLQQQVLEAFFPDASNQK